jgi:hypothetical protein
MIMEVYWESLWTVFVGLSQFHGHIYWLVCEVALSREMSDDLTLLYTRPSNIRVSMLETDEESDMESYMLKK